MAIGRSEDIAPETVVHRIGGGNVANLRLSTLDEKLTPPGISVLLGGTPQEAVTQMRQAFPRSRKWRRTAHTVGTTAAVALRQAGFEIVPDPTTRFPNHARLIHPDGVVGFTDANLERLTQTFRDTRGTNHEIVC
ncbi:hypothetical protein IH992_15505 [Candidatus Poribacteria bacterium]|nr:hypothetical protein [Candidatus Poribacteria bacterium]